MFALLLLIAWECILVKCKYLSIFLLSLVFLQDTCNSAINSGLCEHYYASIKSSKANAYKGPGKNYKISWEYVVRGIPVVIIAKYDHWRLIQDPSGDKVWIHKSLLSTKRSVITVKDSPSQLRENSSDTAKIIADIKKNVVMSLLSVRGNWCKIETLYRGKKYIGWIKKESVFGVSNNETWS